MAWVAILTQGIYFDENAEWVRDCFMLSSSMSSQACLSRYHILHLLVLLPRIAPACLADFNQCLCNCDATTTVCKSCCNNPDEDIIIRFSLKLHCVLCCLLPQEAHACSADSLGTTVVYDKQNFQWFQSWRRILACTECLRQPCDKCWHEFWV